MINVKIVQIFLVIWFWNLKTLSWDQCELKWSWMVLNVPHDYNYMLATSPLGWDSELMLFQRRTTVCDPAPPPPPRNKNIVSMSLISWNTHTYCHELYSLCCHFINVTPFTPMNPFWYRPSSPWKIIHRVPILKQNCLKLLCFQRYSLYCEFPKKDATS